MDYTDFIMDGKHYRLRVTYPSMVQSFSIGEGNGSGDTIGGVYQFDSRGTFYNMTMKVRPDPRYPQDYDQFFLDISDPKGIHVIPMPLGQTKVALDCLVTTGSHSYMGKVAGFHRYDGLTVNFRARRPSRTVED